MEKSILQNINSIYTFQRIFEYIKDNNFNLKLFSHSKEFQKKLDIKLDDYIEKFINKFKIFYEKYLSFDSKLFNDSKEYFTEKSNKDNKDLNPKNYLIERFNKDILYYDELRNKNLVNYESNLKNYFKKYIKSFQIMDHKNIIFNENNNSEILIDIYSPFFNILSKTDFFDEIFIRIYANIIQKYNLFNDYIDKFNELNKSNSNYSIFYYSDNNNIDFFKKFSINFDKIKRLTIQFNKEIKEANYFYKALFSYNLDNLIYLRLCNNYILIDSNSIENINNLKSLEDLHLQNLKFENVFMLKLYNLKKLNIEQCENISFDENSHFLIKVLYLQNCLIIKPKSLLIFPNLEIIHYLGNEINNDDKLTCFDIIDLPNANNLKSLNLDLQMNKIIEIPLDKLPVDHLELGLVSNYNFLKKEEYLKIYEKIMSMNTLKFIGIVKCFMDINIFSQIHSKNYSIKDINITWFDNDDCILYNIQDKFPNLTNIKLYITDYSQGYNQNCARSLEIKENPECKINKFSLDTPFNSHIKFYIQSFETLVSVSFNFCMRFSMEKDYFPIFNDKCKVIFKSLKYFQFIQDSYTLDFSVLKNLYQNMDYMPNLKYFELKCYQKDINEEFINNFIKKILSIDLDIVKLALTKDRFLLRELRYNKYKEYSINELKEIYPNVNINKYKILSIIKNNDDYD